MAVGVGIAGRQTIDDEASGNFGPGVIWRFGTSKDGWHPKVGLNWYKTEISRQIDEREQAFGRLRIRPLMAGYGYTHVTGRTAVSGNLLAGYAFTSFSLDDSASSALRQSLDVANVDVDPANTFVVKPEISFWTDVSNKIGVNFNIGYMMARPFVTLEAGTARDRHRVRADALVLSLGVVYSVF